MSDSPDPIDPTDEPSFGLDLPEVPAPAGGSPYRVLARKYRPQTFAELIGQDAMVQTLANAIQRGRIAHAFLLTGVRGVGKTTTARLIAKALNCVGPDGQGGPTIDPCGVCEPCRAIAEGRHIDVIEMDAASHTGVDDIREIIEAVRYAAVSARYKIYIIDEVHMLSKNAFNALAEDARGTAGACEVPVRDDRGQQGPGDGAVALPAVRPAPHPGREAADAFRARSRTRKGVEVEPEALALIARAADGSARDGLSILDQAIAHGAGAVTAAPGARHARPVRSRRESAGLFGLVLAGDAPGALAALDEAARSRQSIRRRSFAACWKRSHGVTRAKVGGGVDPPQSAEEREAPMPMAQPSSATPRSIACGNCCSRGCRTSMRRPIPREAAEMALLRVIHAADLPDPCVPAGEAERAGGRRSGPRRGGGSKCRGSGRRDYPPISEAWFNVLEKSRPLLAQQLHDHVGLVRYAPPELVLKPTRPLGGDWPRELATALKPLTGANWTVTLSDDAGEPSLLEQEKMAEERVRADVLADPIVRAVIDAFPDAELETFSGWRMQRTCAKCPISNEIMQMAQNAQAELRRRRTISTRSRSRASRVAGWSRFGRPPRAGSSRRHRQILLAAIGKADGRGPGRGCDQRCARQGRVAAAEEMQKMQSTLPLPPGVRPSPF